MNFIIVYFIFSTCSNSTSRNDETTNGFPEMGGLKNTMSDIDSYQPILTNKSDSDFYNILVEISKLAILKDPHHFSDDARKTKWLGANSGVTDVQIEAVETKLNLKLPKEYVAFMKITNGFQAANEVEPTFFTIDKIDFYINYDPTAVEIWGENEYVGQAIKRSIIIADEYDGQQFLLIPPLDEKGEWQFWKFATWIPGDEPYRDLQSYFIKVLDFLKNY